MNNNKIHDNKHMNKRILRYILNSLRDSNRTFDPKSHAKHSTKSHL